MACTDLEGVPDPPPWNLWNRKNEQIQDDPHHHPQQEFEEYKNEHCKLANIL
jgi:hypothetical protein